MKFAQEYAGALPLVFAGDFNFKPGSYHYNSIKTGIFPIAKEYPNTKDIEWDSEIQPMRSAYSKYFGDEPKATVQSLTKGQNKPFIGTLDYIFYNGKCSPVGGTQISDMDESLMMPNETSPSDHVPLEIDFEI